MDTGTSLIAVPNQEFNALTKAWKLQYAGVTCSSEICYAAITCTQLAKYIDDLKFNFGEKKYFTVPASEYLINGADLGLPGYCLFGVQGGLDDKMSMFIFGDSFLRSYYSIYDFEN